MSARTTFILLLSSLSVMAFPSAASEQHEDLVKQFFPAALRLPASDPNREELEQSDYEVLQVHGKERLVAAYTNGFGGAILLIDPAQPRVLQELTNGPMGGPSVSVRTMQLIAGPPEEVIVSYSTPQGHLVDWLYAVDSESVMMIGPRSCSNGKMHPNIGNARYLDLDNDGVFEIINGPVASDSGGFTRDLFTINADGSSSAVSMAHYSEHYRTPGKPQSERIQFNADSGEAVLVMFNGPSGRKMTTAGWVKFNGVLVVTPADFNKGKGEKRLPIRLGSINELEVELSGEPGSMISLIVQKPSKESRGK